MDLTELPDDTELKTENSETVEKNDNVDHNESQQSSKMKQTRRPSIQNEKSKCDKELKSKKKREKSNTGTNEMPLNCLECGKSYKYNRSFWRHVVSHQQEKYQRKI